VYNLKLETLLQSKTNTNNNLSSETKNKQELGYSLLEPAEISKYQSLIDVINFILFRKR